MSYKILQIIPAPELYAEYKLDDGSVCYDRVVCLALTKDPDGENYVIGMVAAGDLLIRDPGETSNFNGYVDEKTGIASPEQTIIIKKMEDFR